MCTAEDLAIYEYDYQIMNVLSRCTVFSHVTMNKHSPIRESVDSLCRDGTDTPIVCVH